MDSPKIVFIGAGNLATQLALACKEAGFRIHQIYSRTKESALALGELTDTSYTSELSQIKSDADIYLYAVKDTALASIIAEVKLPKGIHLHTAGSIPINIFEAFHKNYGAFYPLQTFSKERTVDFSNIPLLIEGNTIENTQYIEELGKKLSQVVIKCSSDQRKAVHLSAVFACNFTNHMYAIAEEILSNANISFDILRPLIEETTAKTKELLPKNAQTGPAVRYDENVINKHLKALDKTPVEKELYEMISKNIYKYCK